MGEASDPFVTSGLHQVNETYLIHWIKETMAKVRKVSGRKKVAKKAVKRSPGRKTRTKETTSELVLPTEESEPERDMYDFSTLLWGERKIGKTSLMSQFPDMTMIMTEPGDKALKRRSVQVKNWVDMKAAVKQLEADDRSANPVHHAVSIDTADIAYQLCFAYVCMKEGFDYPPDNDFGKGWGAISKEWSEFLRRLLRMDKGVFLISHAKVTTLTRRDGTKYDTLGPTLSGQAMGVLEGLVDTIAYYGFDGDERKLVIRGNEYINAGTRIDELFKTADGRIVRSIPMGSSKEESYKNWLLAFSNKQRDVGTLPHVVIPTRKRKTRNG